jgi:predicted DNA-binding antitoxin AbrB/MazE fold protein
MVSKVVVMPKRKLTEGEKTSVEIIRMDLVKEKLARTGESLKDYLNRLIREDMMCADEDLSIRYFKE